MKRCLIIFFSFFVFATYAQDKNSIRGRIINGETDAPVPNASVFITNTSRGTVSGANGEFELLNVPEGTYDLVVSSIGFETQVYTYKAAQLPLRMRVELKPKVQELENVTIEPWEKDGWEKWGKFFMDNFIGRSSQADECKIKNYKSLRFRHSRKRNTLEVVSEEPLIIENRALGYKLQYQLEEFNFNFQSKMLLFFGYCLFDELRDKEPKQRWVNNREKAYNGSIMHFMSSLYHNTLLEEGFEVKRLIKRPNEEKERVKKVYWRSRNGMTSTTPGNRSTIKINALPGAIIDRTSDSAEYYQRIMQQPDLIEEYGDSLLTADSLIIIVDDQNKSLFFQNYLYIVYKKEKEPKEYLLYSQGGGTPYFQRSVVFLLNDRPVVMDAKGNYSMPQDFISYGFWSWSEKISNLLPLDYERKKK